MLLVNIQTLSERSLEHVPTTPFPCTVPFAGRSVQPVTSVCRRQYCTPSGRLGSTYREAIQPLPDVADALAQRLAGQRGGAAAGETQGRHGDQLPA